MGGIFQGITNLFGGLLGQTDAQYAQKKAQQGSDAQSALQKQYGSEAHNVYAGLLSQGQAQQNAGNANYLTLLGKYGALSGLGNPLSYGAPANAQGSGAIANALGINAQGSGVQRQPNNPPAQSVSAPDQNPYYLDPNQQALLNQTNAQLANAQKSAFSQFQQHMTANGITDPRALQLGAEQLQEHFSALQAETQAKFYEQVKQDKLKALEQIISGVSQYQQHGAAEQEAAGAGLLGLAGGAQSAALAQQQSALAASQANDSSISSLLNLGGFALGGGFSGTPRQPSTPPIVSPLSNLTGPLG